MANPNIPSIELIPNQPFVFNANDPNCLGTDNKDYCVLVNECDQIQIQEKLIFSDECSENLLCDSILGPELITNGDFASGLDDWTVDAGWVWDPNAACATNGQNIGQTIAAGLNDGNLYLVTFTIVNYTSNDLSFSLGGTVSGPYNADGTYSVAVTAGAADDDLIFGGAGTFNGCIDDISIREIQCYSEADSWVFGEGTACHNVGSVSPLVSTSGIPASASNCTFELIVTVSGMTSGTLTPSIGADTFSAITANGVYSLYVNSMGGNFLTFTPSTDFDGCINVPELRSICDYPQLALFDLDDNFILDLSIDGGVSVDVEGRHITWTFKLCQLEQILAFGCYKFKLYDQCNNCFVTDNVLTNPEFTTDLSGWLEGGNWVWNAANGGEAMISFSTGFVEQNTGAISKKCAQINVLSIGGANPGVFFYIVDSSLGQVMSFLNITQPGIYSICGTGDVVGFSALNASAEVGSVYAKEIDDCNDCGKYCYQLESNCLNWREEHECTKHIVAYCEENSLGFNFGSTVYVGTGFKLQERFRVINFNPSHNKDRNVQLDSAGAKKLVFAQNEKQFQMRFDYTDQRGHDVIATMMDCDVIQINHGTIDAYPDDYELTKEYVCLTDDYEPEWASRGEQNLAQSQIEITEVPSTIFNQNLT